MMVLALTEGTDWAMFLGRLHPLMLHLPIGLLGALVLVELAHKTRLAQVSPGLRGLLYGTTALAAVLSAGAGWLLAKEGGYAEGTLFWHRWMGTTLAVVFIATAALSLSTAPRAGRWRICLLLSALVLASVTGHFGGTLTHGRGYLTRYAPAWLGGAGGEDQQGSSLTIAGLSGDAEILLTTLRTTCIECHGSSKQKGELRLDLEEGIRSVVVPHDPAESELFRRISLADGDEDLMPPESARLDDETVLAIMRWIRDGASLKAVVAEFETEAAETLFDANLLDELRRSTGAMIFELPGSAPSPLRVDYSLASGFIGIEQLRPLASVSDRIVELSLAGCDFDAAGLLNIDGFDWLRRVHLERSSIDDSSLLGVIDRAPKLHYLNLHSTLVSDSSLSSLSGLQDLQRLVLFGTNVTSSGLDDFASASPRVKVTGALELPEILFEQSGPRMLLAADASAGRIVLMREITLGVLETVWEHEIHQIHDLHLLDNGNVLFQTSWTRLVEIDPRTDEVVWEYDAAITNRAIPGERVEVHAFERRPNGVTMIAESGPSRIIEVDRGGTLLSETPLEVDYPDAHHDTRLVRLTPDDTYLVAHEKDGVVREYNKDGSIVWAFNIPLDDREPAAGSGFDAFGNQVFAAVRLQSGNTLIGTGNGHRVLEVDRQGSIVWSLDQDELDGVRLAWVTNVQELSNGNIVIGNCHAGEAQPQIIEITRDKEIVWRFQDFQRFGNSLSNSVIIEDSHLGR